MRSLKLCWFLLLFLTITMLSLVINYALSHNGYLEKPQILDIARNLPEDPVKRLFINSRNYKPPFCANLFSDNHTSYISDAKRHMKRNRRLLTTASDYINVINKYGCDYFRRIRGYRTTYTSNEEKNFPLAFGILVYKHIEQIERLLRALYMPQNYYCIHIDKKATALFKNALGNITSCFPNAFVASKSYDVRWGRYSVLQADLVCPRELLKYKDWKYFFNLAGLEFPIMSNRQMVRLAMAYNGANDNIVVRRSGMSSEWAKRTQYVFKWKGNDVLPSRTKIRKSQAPHNLSMRRGELHLIASRQFIDFVVTSRVANDFYKWLNETNIPDESFYSTLNSPQKTDICIPGSYNSNSAVHVLNSHTRWKHWTDHKGVKCHGKIRSMICIPGIGDLRRIAADITKPIINKIHLDNEYLVFECLEQYVAKLQEEAKSDAFHFNDDYYKNLNLVKYQRKCS